MRFKARSTPKADSRESPAVSIVIPVHNDEEWVGRALESCLAQTLKDIEIICIDDASTDGTVEVIEGYRSRDARIRLVQQETNQSAFQARRVGVMHAKASYILFLDGDDELLDDAARRALRAARTKRADLVGFGVDFVVEDGPVPRRFERDLQPKHDQLLGEEILPGLFPAHKLAQGHIWRYLWSRDLLRAAYEALPADLRLYRANDIPIAMLGAAKAHKYVSMPDRLYRYYFGLGTSGRRAPNVETFKFYLTGLNSVEAIEAPLHEAAAEQEDPSTFIRSYKSARLSAIQVILRYAAAVKNEREQAQCLDLLVRKIGAADVIRAAAEFFPGALSLLNRHRDVLIAPTRDNPRTVLLYTGNLRSGGVQGVLVSQAKHLQQAGYQVLVGVRMLQGMVYELPPGIDVVEINGESTADILESFLAICREHSVDRIIDHHILYNEDWPYYALMARSIGVSSIGWIHNFALRPMFDFSLRTSFLTEYLPLFEKVVTLSATDVAFWKSQGIKEAVYLPNPASPWLFERPLRSEPRSRDEGPIRLVWWGRIQQHTKRVRELVYVAAALRQLQVDFTLTIVGPDSDDLTAEQLLNEAVKHGVADAIELTGPLLGEELLAAIDRADLYVCTSAIEGYPLTLVEAQALGIPVTMYELPWLALAEENQGLVTAKQGDSEGLAEAIARIAHDKDEYRRLSKASLDAAARALSYDFDSLYSDLLTGNLSAEFRPEPTLAMSDLIINRAVAFHEQNVAQKSPRRRGRNRPSSVRRVKEGVSNFKKRSRRLKVAFQDPQRGLMRVRKVTRGLMR